MTKRPELPIEQTAIIEQNLFLFKRTNRLVARLEKLLDKHVKDSDVSFLICELMGSIKESLEQQQDRDQLKTEIINDLLNANKAL